MNIILEFFQQYGSLFAVFSGLAGILGFAFTLYRASHNRHVELLNSQIKEREAQIDELKKSTPDEKMRLINEQIKLQLADETDRHDQLKKKYASAKSGAQAFIAKQQEQIEAQKQTIAALTVELEAKTETIAAHDFRDKQRTRLLKRAMKLEGRVWERKVVQGTPRFRPLSERHVPIISVLNLKGGVGKTTLTAHLGAALAAKGYRVLLVDLDLQGSLSSLFLGESALADLNQKGKLLRHYLTAVMERRRANLLNFAQPIFDNGSAIIPTADSMAYAELNLTMNWLLKLGRKDTRFLLRRALHQRRITNRFDFVLMDCPPLFNTSCVNALAASDYIMIPATPSIKVAERVPLLLERIKGLCSIINSNLQVAGIVFNRTHGSQLTGWETDLWNDILDRSLNAFQSPVHGFKTTIRHIADVREHEHDFAAPEAGSELFSTFSRLAAELEERLPSDCRRPASIVVGPE